jgi:hypothetical protein
MFITSPLTPEEIELRKKQHDEMIASFNKKIVIGGFTILLPTA